MAINFLCTLWKMDISSFLLGEITSRISKFFSLYYIYKFFFMAIHLWISLVYFMSYFPLLCIIFIHCIDFLNQLFNFSIGITTIQSVIFKFFLHITCLKLCKIPMLKGSGKKMNMYNKLFLVNLSLIKNLHAANKLIMILWKRSIMHI